MEALLASLHDPTWEVIENGHIVITRTNLAINGDPNLPMTVQIPKPKSELDPEEAKIIGLERIARDMLLQVVPDENLASVINIRTTKIIWECLADMCEGSD